MAKHAGGRPSEYNPKIHPVLAEYLARAGMTDIEICVKMGIAEKTLYEWQKKHKEFTQALKNGKEGVDDGVERALLSRAMGWNGMPPDVVACIFWLKNRRKDKWRDRHDFSGDLKLEYNVLKVNEKDLEKDE